MKWGKWRYRFYLFGIRVPWLVYAEMGPFLPMAVRQVRWEEI